MKTTFTRDPTTALQFQIDKTLELPMDEYAVFCQNPFDTYLFLSDLPVYSRVEPNGMAHCLLVLCEGQEDGILVLQEGDASSRQISDLPYARQILILNQNSGLCRKNQELKSIVDHLVNDAVSKQLDGQAVVSFSVVKKNTERNVAELNMSDICRIMAARPEVADVEVGCDGCKLTIASSYRKDSRKLRRLSQKQVTDMCAKHTLWLQNKGGQRADFTNCLLRDINMNLAWLDGATFDGAVLIHVKLNNSDVSHASFQKARFMNCQMSELFAENASFRDAEFYRCYAPLASFTQCNLTNAVFIDSPADETIFPESCIEGAFFGVTHDWSKRGETVSHSEDEWLQSFSKGHNRPSAP